MLNEEVNFASMEGYSVNDSDSTPKFNVNVEPRSKKLILLKRNSDQPKFSVGFKTKITYDADDLVKNIYKDGKKHQVKTGCEEYKIFFYILEHSNGYIFQYENHEKHLEFEANFIFKLDNLRIVADKSKQIKGRKIWAKNKNEKENLTSWVIKLKPGEKTVKKIESINDYDRSAFKYDYTFKTINLVPSKDAKISNTSMKSIIKSRQ